LPSSSTAKERPASERDTWDQAQWNATGEPIVEEARLLLVNEFSTPGLALGVPLRLSDSLRFSTHRTRGADSARQPPRDPPSGVYASLSRGVGRFASLAMRHPFARTAW